MGIISELLRHSWIMKSAENRCAFVRAEYVQILILLLQWTSSYVLPESASEGEGDASHTVSDVTVDDSVTSVHAKHFNSSDLRSVDEAVDSEMRLLLESHDVEKLCYSEVRIGHLRYFMLSSFL